MQPEVSGIQTTDQITLLFMFCVAKCSDLSDKSFCRPLSDVWSDIALFKILTPPGAIACSSVISRLAQHPHCSSLTVLQLSDER